MANNNVFSLEAFDELDHEFYFYDVVEDSTVKTMISDLNDIVIKDNAIMKKNRSALKTSNLFKDYTEINFKLPTIKIHMMTGGGSCLAGMALYDTIEKISHKYPVEFICSGSIMSMGTIILQAGGERYATPNTTFMVHQVSSCLGEKSTKVKDSEEELEETKRINKLIFDILKTKTKMPEELLSEIYEKKKNFYMTAEQALKYGLIDKILK